ncbi:hypothetical protein BD560DRAFT_325840, partial [Blakeslea trispora]
DRYRLIRWLLGWLSSGYGTLFPLQPHRSLKRFHAIHCLHMHRRLTIPSPSFSISFLSVTHASFILPLLGLSVGPPST